MFGLVLGVWVMICLGVWFSVGFAVAFGCFGIWLWCEFVLVACCLVMVAITC